MPSMGSNIILEHFPVGMFQTNCYILGETQSHQAVVIDPGGEVERIAGRIEALSLKLVAILATHAHFDHIVGVWPLQGKLGGEILLHPREQPFLQDRMIGMGAGPSSQSPRAGAVRNIEESDVLEYGPIRMTVFETPGHTPGHVSFHLPEANIVFVGDTIFAGSIGRTDFPGGSHDRLIRSVREKIFTLPGETIIYPGHGPETTVDRERRMNPFFR